MLNGIFDYVPGQLTAARLSALALADRLALCGQKPEEPEAKVVFGAIDVLDRKGLERTTLKAQVWCVLKDSERPVTASFRLTHRAQFARTRRMTRLESERGYFNWSLTGYEMLSHEPPGPWADRPKPQGCPASFSVANSGFARCDPSDKTLCWYGERGCVCPPGAGVYLCAQSFCPVPRPAAGSACIDPRRRCSPQGGIDASDAGDKTLWCRKGVWVEDD